MALSADTLRVFDADSDLNELPVKASAAIYKGSVVGTTAGYARALVAGDLFAGFAVEAKTGTGTDGAVRVHVKKRGLVQLAVTSVAVTDIGAAVYATDDTTFVLTQGASNSYVGRVKRFVSSGIAIVEFDALETNRDYVFFNVPVNLASITAAGDVLTTYTPGFAGRIESIDFHVTVPVTTAAKAASLNAEIGTTNLTGGVVALTSANCTPLGVQVAGTAITAANAFLATDTISIEAASVTAFSEGAGVLVIKMSRSR